jgi:uncharacterized protein YgiM (DUF1202 family)
MAKRELNLNKEETKVEATETVEEAAPVFGTVVNCSKLRIRKTPSLKADVLGELDKGTKVEILDDKSAKFYKIEGGYCMKDFIEIQG